MFATSEGYKWETTVMHFREFVQFTQKFLYNVMCNEAVLTLCNITWDKLRNVNLCAWEWFSVVQLLRSILNCMNCVNCKLTQFIQLYACMM